MSKRNSERIGSICGSTGGMICSSRYQNIRGESKVACSKSGDSLIFSSCTQTRKLKDVEQHLIINIPTVGADLQGKFVY